MQTARKVTKSLLAAALLAVAAGVAVSQNLHWALGLELGLVRPPKPACPLRGLEAPFEIAHGGGRIDGIPYTNSREAVEASLARGVKVVELDLRKTLDGQYFGCHRIKECNRWSGGFSAMPLALVPPTASQMRARKIHGKYTPLFLSDVSRLLSRHPDVWLYVDKAEDYRALVEQFPDTSRMIVEVHSARDAAAAFAAGVRHIAVNGPDPVKAASEWNASAISVANAEELRGPEGIRLLDAGGCLLCSQMGTRQAVPRALWRPGVGFFSR